MQVQLSSGSFRTFFKTDREVKGRVSRIRQKEREVWMEEMFPTDGWRSDRKKDI